MRRFPWFGVCAVITALVVSLAIGVSVIEVGTAISSRLYLLEQRVRTLEDWKAEADGRGGIADSTGDAVRPLGYEVLPLVREPALPETTTWLSAVQIHDSVFIVGSDSGLIPLSEYIPAKKR